MRRCHACGVSVPEKSFLAHEKGKRHQWTRFYGDEEQGSRTVGPFRCADEVAPRCSRPVPAHDVPQRVADCVRHGREVALHQLSRQSSHADFGPARNKWFTPEALCPVMLLHSKDPLSMLRQPQAAVALAPTPASVALGAALLERNSMAAPGLASHASEVTTLRISKPRQLRQAQPAPEPDPMADPSWVYTDELALAAALTAVASALARPRRFGLSLHIEIPKHLLALRHRIDIIARAFANALGRATGLSSFTLVLRSSDFRASDAEALVDAARHSWRAREWAVFQGTLPSRHCVLRVLPPALVQHILDLVAMAGRTRVRVVTAEGTFTYGGTHASPQPPSHPPSSATSSSAAAPGQASATPWLGGVTGGSAGGAHAHAAAADGANGPGGDAEAAAFAGEGGLDDAAMLPPPDEPPPPPPPPASGGGADLDAIAAMLLS